MNLNDVVQWGSRSSAGQFTRIGRIVAVIESGNLPGPGVAWHLYRKFHLSSVMPRQHESYLVAAPEDPSPRKKQTLYWPRVSALRLVAKEIKDAVNA